MTRPDLVRADTIDLQDQGAPSAQDHSQYNLPQDASNRQLGPHHAAEIRHVQQERHSEELNLQEAWNQASANLNPDSSQAETDGFNDEQLHAQHHNGLHGEEVDNGDEDDADQNSDDDMMDRMSSSPSIDDGAYPTTSPGAAQWPPRSSSLTPTRGTFNRSASSTPDSSPFLEAPVHLPLSFAIHHEEESERAQEEEQDAEVHLRTYGSSISTKRSQDSSPFAVTTDQFPLSARKSNANRTYGANTSPLPSENHHHHHLSGEYYGQTANEGFYDNDNDDDSSSFGNSSEDDQADSQTAPVTTLPRSTRQSFAKSVVHLAVFDREDSADSIDMRHLLLPNDDPLLGDDDMDENDSICSTDSSSSWATVSDASNFGNENHNGSPDDLRDDDSDDLSFYHDKRFVDSGWGGECLRETEDIDFDFVYALHTFIATVEGQANATKGDTMVLLDDSNSYWWLVRIVKDASIGYLPAEHIETPTERLARLNKHRNVDLSQTMLGDNMEKSKNPLKKAIKRRNAKTVQFAAPTYVEASDYEYDTEDEDNAVLADAFSNGDARAATGHEIEHAEHRESLATDNGDESKSRMSDSSSSDDSNVKPPIEEPLGSPTLVDKTEAAPLKSRKGTPRNADSFLKDDSAEPRRITLTPNILRDDNSSLASLEKTRSSSFESLEKDASPPKETKDDKKKKEKKQGMLSGLFKSKKKDKKGKDDDGNGAESEKVSGEMSRQTSGSSSPTLERNPSQAEKKGKLQKSQPAAINTSVVAPTGRDSPKQQTQSQPLPQVQSPLQTQVSSPTIPRQAPLSPQTRPSQSSQPEQEEHPTQFYAELEGSQVAYEAPTGQEDQIRESQSRQSTRSPELQQSSSMAALTAITNIIRPNSHSDEPKRQKVKKAKRRVELDDFDEVDEDEDEQRDGDRLSESPVEITHNTFMHGTEAVHIPMNMDEQENSTQGERTPSERVSDEGERSSSPSMLDMPTEGEPFQESKTTKNEKNVSNPFDDNSENVSDITDDDPTPVPSKPQSPLYHTPGMPNLQQTPTPPPALSAPFPPPRHVQNEEVSRSTPEGKARPIPQRGDSQSSTASAQTHPSPSPSTASVASKDSFSNASLRAWLDGGEGNDIRDMLLVIHDKSDVQPVPRDHPLMKGLWEGERHSVDRMMGELDGLLGNWLGKKKESHSRSVSRTGINGTAAGVGIVGA